MRLFSSLAWLLIAIGCTRAPAPATPCPAPAAAAPAVPAEDDALRKWKAIAATPDKAPPSGTTVAALVPELLAYLGSPDPVRRDNIAYEVLTAWLRGGALDDAGVRALRRQLLDNLAAPIADPAAPGGVFLRSFSALVLAEVVRRDTKQPLFTDDERRELVRATVAYAGREPDLRGHTGATGWAHAAAHTADLLARLAQLPQLTAADRAQLLDAVTAFVARRHGTVLAYGEDGRLAAAVIATVRAGLAEGAIDRWLAAVSAPLTERLTPVFDAGLFAAQRNARNLLFTLFVQLSLAPQPGPGEQQLLAGVRKLFAE